MTLCFECPLFGVEHAAHHLLPLGSTNSGVRLRLDGYIVAYGGFRNPG